MKVAIAGGFGFLGTYVTKKFRESGYGVIPFSRRNGTDIRVLSQINDFLSAERPEIMINCAAHVGGIAYNEIAPVEIYEDNLLIGFNLVHASYCNGVNKFVNVMPNCTYPGVADIYTEDGWWEGKMHDTVISYGMPRKAVWAQCWAYKVKHDFNSIHIVLPNLYGPGDHFDPVRSHALGALIKKIVEAKIKNEDQVEIWGTGDVIREWGYVEDIAEGIFLTTTNYNDIEILNLGSGKGYTIREIAEMIKESISWKGNFVFDISRPDGAPKKILDVSRMKRVINWESKTPINKGIRQTIDWYMKEMKRKQDRL
jgi:GDP-L-fucose synthase